MSKETAQRLQETAAKCLSSLEKWNGDLNDNEAREALLDAVHELRKVTSRLEIDIAMNDRKATNSRPLPIPEHKSKMEKKAKNQRPLSEILPVAEIRDARNARKIEIQNSEDDTDDNDIVDQSPEDNDGEEKQKRRPRRKKREDRKSDDSDA